MDTKAFVEKARALVARVEQMEREMTSGLDPDALAEYKSLRPGYEVASRFISCVQQLEDAKAMLESEQDEEMRSLIQEEIEHLEKESQELQNQLKKHLVPRNPQDSANALVEIRAGAGGEEAALFAGDLFRMYTRFAESQGFKVVVADSHPTPLGGLKEIVFVVEGRGAFGKFRFESGVHRVQRVPDTESSGRIHTSSASVVVLPEKDASIKIEINPNDLEIDTMRAGGPGGQHQNMTDSAVRITHKPTGLVVVCREERSQHKNKEKALRILAARLAERERERQERETGKTRRSAIGTGDRSEKIRTYNFPQNRLTDHRIGLTLYQLDRIMDGELEPVVEALAQAEAEKLLSG